MHQVILPAPLHSPFPSIEVSFAPLQEKPPVQVEQHPIDSDEDDAFRATHLLPPPVFSPKERRSPSKSSAAGGPGLSQEDFQNLLKSSSRVSGRSGDLRKELAVKAQRSKLLERRARFLSKIGAPPSPSAADIPVTPPDSPSVFHYSLPSPGLDSPLIVFEKHIRDSMLSKRAGDRKGWVEHVDFRVQRASTGRLPSLDDITAHLSSVEKSVATLQGIQSDVPRAPLPGFLKSGVPSRSRPLLPIGVRDKQAPPPRPLMVSGTISSSGPAISPVMASPQTPESSRVRTGRDMMLTLRRRVEDSEGLATDRLLRRTSAPAEMTRAGTRTGFLHPVLSRPGGF